jgi:predicted short-subunit dehydrogenase-like oxidoreductase (DUF2520 family)
VDPLFRLQFSLVGPGRVGESLARWACARGARLSAIGGRDARSAERLASDLNGHALPWREIRSEGEDLLLVCVSDPALPAVAQELGAHRQARVALHSSGLFGSEALASLRDGGTQVGGLHPLRAFSHPSRLVDEASGVFFALCGDEPAQAMGRQLAQAWHGVAEEIPQVNRDIYHLAATLAAGGVVTLLALTEELSRIAGLPGSVRQGYLDLARGAIDQAKGAEWSGAALTGPAPRGDDRSVLRHRHAVEAAAPDRWPAIRELLRVTVALSPDLTDEARARLVRALDG